jgi:ABC-type nitrate/sulfonate/bicarbonate transport system permease component
MKTEGLGRKATWALRALSVLIILIAWELYGRSSNPLLFTYPTAVADAAVDMVADGTLIRALGRQRLLW